MIRQTTAMTQQIAQRKLPRHPRIVHLKIRIVIGHTIVPADGAFANKRASTVEAIGFDTDAT